METGNTKLAAIVEDMRTTNHRVDKHLAALAAVCAKAEQLADLIGADNDDPDLTQRLAGQIRAELRALIV